MKYKSLKIDTNLVLCIFHFRTAVSFFFLVHLFYDYYFISYRTRIPYQFHNLIWSRTLLSEINVKIDIVLFHLILKSYIV